MDGTDDNMLWNGREQGGNVKNECEEDEGTDFEFGDSDTGWLKVVRIWHALCIECIQLIQIDIKIFFLADILFIFFVGGWS